MKNLQGKWVLVTGASSGLGVEFAKLFAERNANLVLVARRTGPMEQLAEELRRAQSVQLLVIGMDLSRPGAAAELKAQLDARGIGIEVLVNNAGFGMYGEFLDQSVEKITEMMRLNIMTLTELTHIFGQGTAKSCSWRACWDIRRCPDMRPMPRARGMCFSWARRSIKNWHLAVCR